MEKSICSRGIIVTQDHDNENSVFQNSGCIKLNTFNWLNDIPTPPISTEIVEVQFKNTRKGFYRNVNNIPLKRGDVVAVEASPGHDIGTITLAGWLVNRQLKKAGTQAKDGEFKKVYRKAKPADIEKWLEAISLENNTMIRSRQIVTDLKLNMKIGDVEYQGDKTKAVFYYIADERVDFRELIKVLAEEFQIRVEMRQIGARQEAGRIGGIGSCGRELCCSSWINNFVSVATNSARVQEISLNPQKLAGLCGKLKCCLNFELDSYVDARKDFPRTNIPLETKDATYYHQKTDIFKGTMWYSSDPNTAANLIAISVERAKDIIAQNAKGVKPLTLLDLSAEPSKQPELGYGSVIEQASLTRFDEKKKRRPSRKKRRKPRKRPNNEK